MGSTLKSVHKNNIESERRESYKIPQKKSFKDDFYIFSYLLLF